MFNLSMERIKSIGGMYCYVCWLIVPTVAVTGIAWIVCYLNSGFKYFIWNYNPDEIWFVFEMWALSLPLTILWLKDKF